MENFESDDVLASSDVTTWVKAYLKVVKERPELGQDEGFLLGWFANLYIKGSDDGRKNVEISMTAKDRELRAMSYYVSHHCHRNPIKPMHLQTPQEIELEAMLSADRSMLSFIREHMIRIEGGEVGSR